MLVMPEVKTQLWRQVVLMSLFSLTFLTVACQTQPGETKGDEQQPTGRETSVSQAITPNATSPPTATPARSSSPLLLPTDAPTALPTNTPPLPPTPTAIPANEPTPSATNTPIPAPVAASPPNEVNLVTLEESLAVLDRVERRKVELPSGPLPYEIIIYADYYHIGDSDRKPFHHLDPQANPFIAAFEVPYKGKVVNLSIMATDVNRNETSTHIYLNNTRVAVLNQYVSGEVSSLKIPIDPGLIKVGTNEIKIEGRITQGYDDIDDIEFWDLKLQMQ